MQSPPSEKILLERAKQLSGITLKQLALKLHLDLPDNMVHAKGWVGQSIEIALGANAKNAAMADFAHLGIELKTLPLNEHGQPKESTYICVVQHERKHLQDWEHSLVRNKLKKILWVPIEASLHIPIEFRHIGTPFIWQANQSEEQELREDWEELRELIITGELDKVISEMGQYLQIRPKAQNAKIRIQKNNLGYEAISPRGFYLRSAFTKKILNQRYQIV